MTVLKGIVRRQRKNKVNIDIYKKIEERKQEVLMKDSASPKRYLII
ncbi:hypothetical protein [Bacillus sp. SM2101]|nr:hypothetical protein [Bacillus sp. SM2101]